MKRIIDLRGGTTTAVGRKLSEGELSEKDRSCPVCQGNAPRKPVFRIQEDPDVDFLFCPRCLGCSASPMPNPKTLANLYDGFFHKEGDRYTFHGMERLARHILHQMPGKVPGLCFAILEFGGGDGTLGRIVGETLVKRNPGLRVEVKVVERFEGGNRERSGVSVTFLDDLDQASGSFPLVITSAATEHVPLAGLVLSRLFDRVAPGGLFYARTPWILPIARILGRHIDTFYPYHLHDFGAPFWNRIRETFTLNAEIVSSGPSIVQTQFARAPLLSLSAYLAKAPADMELFLLGRKGRTPLWPFVGGWEIFLRFSTALPPGSAVV